MARTHTAPWDMNRNTGIAPYNAICPICKSPCYSGAIPNGMSYTCPKCGTVKLTTPITVEEFENETHLLRTHPG